MTTSPIPVGQFGAWLGELVTALQSLDGQTVDAEAPNEASANPAATSPFQPGPAKLLRTIGQGFRDSSRASAGPLPHVNNSRTRAAARLRDRIIHNLGSK